MIKAIEMAVHEGETCDVFAEDLDGILSDIECYAGLAVKYQAQNELSAVQDELIAIVERAISCYRTIEELPR